MTPPPAGSAAPPRARYWSARRVLARHGDFRRHHGEAVPGVVAGIADEEDEPPATGMRPGEAGLGERPADAAALPFGVDRERAEQEAAGAREAHRPEADRADEAARLARP